MHDREYLLKSIKEAHEEIDNRLTLWAEGNETDCEICKHQFVLDRLGLDLLRKGIQFEDGELPEIKYLIYTIMYFIERNSPLCSLLEIYEAQKRFECYEKNPDRRTWVDNHPTTTCTGVPEVLTIDEAADYLKVSASSVRRLVEENRIPFFRIGNRVRILKTGLVAALSRPREGS